MRKILIGIVSLGVLTASLGCSNAFENDFSELPQIESSGFDWPRTLSSPAGEIVRSGPATDILTLSAGHDEIVFDLLGGDTTRLAGVSSATPSYSNIAAQVESLSPIGKNVEQILDLNPDIVIVDKFTTADFISQLKLVNIPVFQTTEDDEDFNIPNILTLGYLLGLEDEAAALAQTVRDRLSAVRDSVPEGVAPRVLLASKYEQIWASGGDSTGGKILGEIGVTNVAEAVPANNGVINIEAIVDFNPEFILINGGGEQFRDELLEHPALVDVPAVASQNVAIVNDLYFNVLSHWNTCGVEEAATVVFSEQTDDLTVCEPFVE